LGKDEEEKKERSYFKNKNGNITEISGVFKS
jgi:hypothetical protein